MNFVKHSDLVGLHAFLGASSYHWLNYTDDKLLSAHASSKAKERGTELHDFACQCIRLGQKLPASKKTINMYVNDGISYRLTPEQVLFYSRWCFGTADTIGFKKNLLRIHDYKSGEIPASMKQLYVYDALFCLEYGVKPEDIEIENRIYQNDEIVVENPTAEIIRPIMDKIIHFDQILEQTAQEGV